MELDNNDKKNESKETVGSYISQARENAGKSQIQFAQEIKVTVSVLKALESNEFEKLPAEAYVRGYLNSISRNLHLDRNKVLELFNRDYKSEYNDPQFGLAPESHLETTTTTTSRHSSDSNTSAITVVVILVILIGAFVFFLKFSDVAKENSNDAPKSKQIVIASSSSSLNVNLSSNNDSLINDSTVIDSIQTTDSSGNVSNTLVKVDSMKKDEKRPDYTSIIRFKALVPNSNIKAYRHGPNRKLWYKVVSDTSDYYRSAIAWYDTINIWLEKPENWEFQVNNKMITPKAEMKILHGKIVN